MKGTQRNTPHGYRMWPQELHTREIALLSYIGKCRWRLRRSSESFFPLNLSNLLLNGKC